MSINTRSREVAKRLFARELNLAEEEYKAEDGEYAPSYLVLPSGGRANRVFMVGTLSEKETVNGGDFNIRIADPSGEFTSYAGEYNPEAVDNLRDIEAPAYVSLVGKPDTFSGDDGETITTVRPERIVQVTKETRDAWVAETAEMTLERLERDPETHESVNRALDVHGEQGRELVANEVINALENAEDT